MTNHGCRIKNVEKDSDSEFVIRAYSVIRHWDFVISSAEAWNRVGSGRPSGFHLQEQHRHIDFVAHFIGRSAVKNVADEPVAVRRHRNQINFFLARELNDLIGRLTKCENGIAGETLCGKFTAPFFEVKAVLFHFITLCELELIEIARHPSIGHVNEEQLRAGHSRQRLDVGKDGLIGWAVFERDEDMVVHVRNDK
jgi:hypothetical protein